MSPTPRQGSAGLTRLAAGPPDPTVAVRRAGIGGPRLGAPVKDGKPGAPPRRIADVVQQGDVVMVEPASAAAPATPSQPAKTPPAGVDAKAKPAPATAPLPRLTLRQIPVVQGAMVSLDPTTGRVLAMVGGWSFESSQFNRATQAQRQPGSSFKPFVYLAALQQGISPSQRFLDAPVVIDTPDGRWRPHNYEMEFGGPTPLRIALEKSLNLVTLRVARLVGMDAVANTAIAFHEVDSMPRVLPAALGAVSTTVLREAGAYAALDVGGREVLPTLVDSVQDRDGHVVWRPSASSARRVPTRERRRNWLTSARKSPMRRAFSSRHHDAGRRDPRHRSGRDQRARPPDRRQDRHEPGVHRRLVLRLHRRPGDHGLGGFRQLDAARQQRNGRRGRRADLARVHGVALKNRPVLTFPQPPGVTMAAWDSGSGTVTDAFKPNQVPGGSGPLGGEVAAPARGRRRRRHGATAGMAKSTAGMGGIY